MHRTFGKNDIFLSGYAKLPSNITARKLYEEIAVCIVVDKKTGEIRDAECTLSTMLGREFVNDIIIGCNLRDLDRANNILENNYHGSAQKAIITALKNCKKKFDVLD